MMTIEIRRDPDRRENYKLYTVKCSLMNTTTRFHTCAGKKSWKKYAVLMVGFEVLNIDRKRFALMLSRIRNDNRAEARRKA
jgi:hypothetical protein